MRSHNMGRAATVEPRRVSCRLQGPMELACRTCGARGLDTLPVQVGSTSSPPPSSSLLRPGRPRWGKLRGVDISLPRLQQVVLMVLFLLSPFLFVPGLGTCEPQIEPVFPRRSGPPAQGEVTARGGGKTQSRGDSTLCLESVILTSHNSSSGCMHLWGEKVRGRKNCSVSMSTVVACMGEERLGRPSRLKKFSVTTIPLDSPPSTGLARSQGDSSPVRSSLCRQAAQSLSCDLGCVCVSVCSCSTITATSRAAGSQ